MFLTQRDQTHFDLLQCFSHTNATGRPPPDFKAMLETEAPVAPEEVSIELSNSFVECSPTGTPAQDPPHWFQSCDVAGGDALGLSLAGNQKNS